MNRYLLLIAALLSSIFVPALACGQALPGLVPYREGDLWGYTDTAGTIRIKPQWRSAGLFHDNHATVTVPGQERNILFCLIDTTGNYLISPQHHWNGYYGMLNSHDAKGRWGMIGKTGALLLPYAYDAPGTLQCCGEGSSLIPLANKGLMGVADSSGKVWIPPRYKVMTPVYDPAQHLLLFLARKENGQWALIGNNYQEQTMPACDSIWVAGGGWGWLGFTQNGHRGIIRKDGRIAVPALYEEVIPMHDEQSSVYFLVKTAGLYGVVNESGKLVVPARYRWPPSRYADGNFRMVETPGKDLITTVISPEGKVLLPAVKGEVVVYPDSVVLIRSRTLIDSGGNNYWRELSQRLDPLTFDTLGQAQTYTRKTDWRFKVPEPSFCGTAAYENQMLEQLIPKYYMKGLLREFKGFQYNDRAWEVSGYVLLNDSLRPARDTACFAVTSNYGGHCYTGVVDEQHHFVFGPFEGGIIYAGNIARNELLVRYPANNTSSLTDTAFRPLSPQIRDKIKTVLRKNKAARYLVEVSEYAYHPSPQVQTVLQNIRQRQRGTYIGTAYTIERVVDDSSRYIASLEPYRIAYICDSTGTPKSEDNEGRLLLVTDSNLTQGFLDPDGVVVYPQLSFRYARLSSGNHLGIAAAEAAPLFQATDSAGFYGLVDTKNEIVYPQVSFHHRKPARLWDRNLVFFPDEQALVDSLNQPLIPGATELRVEKATTDKLLVSNSHNIAGLYTCSYKSATGQYLQVYIDRNGRVYGKD